MLCEKANYQKTKEKRGAKMKKMEVSLLENFNSICVFD